MIVVPRPAGNTTGPPRSIVVRMTLVLVALLWSTAALAEASTADDPVPNAAMPPAGQAPVPQPTPSPTRPPASAAILPIDQRLEAYDQFRTMYETARFDEALPLAQRVVELSEVHTDREIELPIAYNNLGATQYQLGDYPAAEVSYRKSLELLEASHGISSRRLIVPLSGLGAVYAALDQHALAVPQFDRALAVSRRSEGLFNLAQLTLINQVADSRYALGDYGGVERDHFYELKIAEQNYGFDDPRTLPAAMRLASFYEGLSEFVAARGLYLRIRDISMKESGGFNPLTVESLIAIGRTHRMQYTLNPESLDDHLQVRDEITGEPVERVYRESRVPALAVDRAGLKSIEKALELLRATPDPPRLLLARTLTELGDWYQATTRPQTALPFYAEASTLYAADPESGNPLLVPRMIFYRAPHAAKRGVGLVTGKVIVRETVFDLVVTANGDTSNITVVTSDMSEAQLAQSRRALDRAIYSPRFEIDKPVATEGVRFTSDWQELKQPEPSSTTGT